MPMEVILQAGGNGINEVEDVYDSDPASVADGNRKCSSLRLL